MKVRKDGILENQPIIGSIADGSTASDAPVLIAGEDPSGNVAKVQTAADGDLVVHQHSASQTFGDTVSNTRFAPINETDSGVMVTPIFPWAYNGTTWDRVRGSATDGLTVNLGTNNDVTVSNTVTVDLGANNDVTATGNVAHDAADSGNPLKIGGKARTTNPTAVADADRVDATFDDVGRQVVVVGQPRDLTTHGNTTITTTSETTILAAGGAGVFNDLTMLILSNTSNDSTEVAIKDSTAGTTRMTIGLAPKGGAVINFPRPVTQATANNNWTATLGTAVTSVEIFVQADVNV